MTFWHSLVSLRAHLAHLPSPVMVMLSSAARVRTVTAANHTATTPATNANDFFIVHSFPLGLRASAPLTGIGQLLINDVQKSLRARRWESGQGFHGISHQRPNSPQRGAD